jgi:heme exporter protein A
MNAISFELKAGDMLCVTGTNGAGKSTLLKALAGLIQSDAGTIHWQHHPIQSLLTDYRAALHYVGHLQGVKSGLTVIENVKLMMQLSGHHHETSSSAYQNVLEQLQFTNLQHQLARSLSQGQQRRLALAKLALHHKPLWILDEPLTALDHTTAQWFLSALSAHLASGNIAIISTHQIETFQTFKMKHIELISC